MKKVTAIDEINGLLRPYFSAKVMTNNFLSLSVYERYIRYGAISYFEYSESLFFVLHKEFFDLLYFHIPCDQEFDFSEICSFLERDTVSECVFRPKSEYKQNIENSRSNI